MFWHGNFDLNLVTPSQESRSQWQVSHKNKHLLHATNHNITGMIPNLDSIVALTFRVRDYHDFHIHSCIRDRQLKDERRRRGRYATLILAMQRAKPKTNISPAIACPSPSTSCLFYSHPTWPDGKNSTRQILLSQAKILSLIEKKDTQKRATPNLKQRHQKLRALWSVFLRLLVWLNVQILYCLDKRKSNISRPWGIIPCIISIASLTEWLDEAERGLLTERDTGISSVKKDKEKGPPSAALLP